MLTQTRPDGEVTSFSYDNNGNLSSLSPPGRPAHLFEYTPVDLESKYAPPEAGFTPRETETFYTLDREVDAVVLPDGRVIDLDYDPAGRLSSVVTSAGVYGYSYDFADRVETLTAPGGETLVFGYDGSQLTQSIWAGTVNGSITSVYDADLRLSSQLVNGDHPVEYHYDQDSILESYSISGAGGTPNATLVTTRNVLNGRLETTTAGVVTDERHYNAHGELDHYTARVSSVVVFEVDYVRDGLGRIDVKTETLNGTTKAFDYDYDLAGRLTDVWEDAVLVEHYEYDPNGNRTLGVVRGVASVGIYDDQDRLLSYGDFTYTYTANGELLTKTDTSNGDMTLYSYDELGNLREATLPNGDHLEYVIDGQNRRIGKKVNGTLVQGLLYGDQLDPIAELDGSGNVVSRFGYGTVGHSADIIVKAGRAYRAIMDHLGSPRLVVDQLTGAITQELEYDAWGNLLTDSAPGWQPFGFTGGIYDSSVMLTRLGARDLSSGPGTWTAKDPLNVKAGTNFYAYSANNPVSLLDPSGLEFVGPITPQQRRIVRRLIKNPRLGSAARRLATDPTIRIRLHNVARNDPNIANAGGAIARYKHRHYCPGDPPDEVDIYYNVGQAKETAEDAFGLEATTHDQVLAHELGHTSHLFESYTDGESPDMNENENTAIEWENILRGSGPKRPRH
ncbi:MAG: hypothetical protein HY791_23970 [Deltaproteobacteria bacterium]|nr:hypothetical protein [Deltaproteobacteria bacterium]